MKRYFVFSCSCYYPGGGMNDFVDDFVSLEAAKREGDKALKESDWVEILDIITKKLLVKNSESNNEYIKKNPNLAEWHEENVKKRL